ncbi:replication-relaxation family protein [Domibacillus sp. A3M-37]|uniref:replication-relaxation family protein n=1 Tax=Domibacillus sp. A3M-37 TaxID=2962037 RepID=UPI0020B722AC|nr:replication-relaxation family protein [Domibacillus sp. A3M-37]MCP3764091.1 replication-relaxation family protein [Domibacillus sp. A3M-37]
MDFIDGRGKKTKYNVEEILIDIYRMRALTIGQIADVFFGGRKHYVYKKLKRMQEDGLIADMPHHEKGGRLIQKLYYVTNKGIDLLEQKGYLTGKKRLERFNKPEKSKVDYVILTNNIYVLLKKHGIKMIDSRQWKSEKKLDRNAMVRGGIVYTEEEQYGLYAFFNEIGEQSESEEERYVSQKTIQRFLKELENKGKTQRYICLIYGKNMYEQLEKAIKKHRPSILELNLLPCRKNRFAYDLICTYKGINAQKNRFHRISGIVPLNDDRNAQINPNQSFFSYIGKVSSGEEVYVVDYLMMNIIAIQALYNHYSHEKYLRDGRKVYLFCWEPIKNGLKKEFQAYPHIEIIPVPIEMVKEWKGEKQIGSQQEEEIFSL